MLGDSPRLLPLMESPNSGPQISFEVIGSPVGKLSFHIIPLTYTEYMAMFPQVNLNEIFFARPLNEAGGMYE